MANILLIEDDEQLSQILVTRLTEAQYHVDLAFEGEQGLWMLSQNQYDLILLDLDLPGIGGLEVLAKIKGKEQSQHVPVFILTNKDNDADLNKAKQLGANQYLIKANYNLDDILRIVQQMLNK
ncbi:response regulator [Candidatus Beckwithbacteria bacterium]|nr:response regulator [Candidatus Beckwithbacteria bacterium]